MNCCKNVFLSKIALTPRKHKLAKCKYGYRPVGGEVEKGGKGLGSWKTKAESAEIDKRAASQKVKDADLATNQVRDKLKEAEGNVEQLREELATERDTAESGKSQGSSREPPKGAEETKGGSACNH